MADYDLQYQDTYIDTLLATANELKTAGYIYKGVATPSTNPGTPTERVAYLASEPGTYTNFGGIVITSGLYSLTFASGTWTGTQMSAGSDVEVVQTTGQSTTNVMSQKAVTEALNETKYYIELSTAAASYPSNVIGSNGKWTSVSGADSFLLPVTPNQKIHVKGNGNATGTIYAFLTNNTTTTGTTASFAQGYEGRVTADGNAEFDIVAPADANYLWFLRKTPSYSLMPTLSTERRVANLVSDTSIYDNIKVDLSELPLSHRAINSNNKWSVTSADVFSILLPVSEGQVYDFVTSNNSCIYAFLTSADINYAHNTTPSFVSGLTGRRTIPANSKWTITIPSTCTYIYMHAYTNTWNTCYLPEISLHGASNIKKMQVPLDKTKLCLFGIDLSLYYKYNRVISASNHWYMASGVTFSSVMIPVNEGDSFTIIGNKNSAQYYAFLTSTDNGAQSADTPSFVTGYERRYAINAGEKVSFTIPADCKFLFLQTNYPPMVYINNKALDIAAVDDSNTTYNLVYDEDFNNGIDENIWKPVQWGEGMGSYANVVFADDKNWYADSSCMVLKLEKRGNKYYAPYISTAQTFAINKGKIEVRVKCSIADVNLGWCFWTFGQNGNWPDTLEIDLYEKITGNATQYVHYHYKNSGGNVDATPVSVPYTDFTDWHTLAVEWDATKARTFYDGEQTSEYSFADSIYPLTYPQQLCFNIKCNSSYNGGDAYLFVDYVKVWVDKDSSPIIGFTQADIALSIDESVYVNPTFLPTDCINRAFSLTSSDEDIVRVREWANDKENHFLLRMITGVAAGTATLTMTAANGSTIKTFTVTVE